MKFYEITPSPVFIQDSAPSMLACGGDLKNVFSLNRKGVIFSGPSVGDLENADAFRLFRQSIEDYKEKLKIKPEMVVVDKHPAYFSSRHGRKLGLPIIEIQHHHAHVAAVMAEHELSGKVIGLALDGTGYGEDGTIWGGEILIASYSEFRRVGYFKPLVLPGGDAAAKEPWRTAVGLMFRVFGEEMFNIHPQFVERIGSKRVQIIVNMIKAGFNCPLSSGAGRLFDGVGSLLGVADYNSFEAEAPIKLEKSANIHEIGLFRYSIRENGEIDFDSMIKQIVEWSIKKKDITVASAMFHNTIAESLLESCKRIRKERKLNQVCLGGGVFQNQFLLKRLAASLEKNDFQVFFPQRISPNDSSISVGQLAAAVFMI